MTTLRKRVFASVSRLFLALFCVTVLVFGYYWFAHPGFGQTYTILGFEVSPMTMGYISIGLMVFAFLTHGAGQIMFWCKREQDPVTRQLMCGPLYVNALYLVLIIFVVVL